MIILSQTFTFEAAHFLPSAEEGNHNRRLHGHSFKAEIVVSGRPNPKTGILIHLEEFYDLCNDKLRSVLDHSFLNEIKGLEHPTLENICAWMWDEIEDDLPQVSEVILYRDSCGQKCRYIKEKVDQTHQAQKTRILEEA